MQFIAAGPQHVQRGLCGTDTGARNYNWAQPALYDLGFWGAIGSKIVLYLAGLSKIPRNFTERRNMDGASPLPAFLVCNLPQLSSNHILHSVQCRS